MTESTALNFTVSLLFFKKKIILIENKSNQVESMEYTLCICILVFPVLKSYNTSLGPQD